MFQQLLLVGRLGRDPEMRYMPDGTAVTNFSVATERKWRSEEEMQSETMWVRVQVWGAQAESSNQYLSRGSKVLVEGRLLIDPTTGGPRLYQRQDGTIGTSFEMRAQQVRFLDGKAEAAARTTGEMDAVAEEVG